MEPHTHIPATYRRLGELLPAKTRVVLLLPRLATVCRNLEPAVRAWTERRLGEGEAKRAETPFVEELLGWSAAGRRKTMIAEARKDLRVLLRLPEAAARRSRVERSQSRFRSPALVALLLGRAEERIRHEPLDAESWADLAVAVSRKLVGLEAAAAPGEVVERCHVLALAFLGNAQRARGEITTAGASFARALEGLRGELTPWVRGQVLSLHGSLLKDQRRLEEARECLETARRELREAGASAPMIRVLLNLASVHKHAGDPGRALELMTGALEALEPQDDPHLLLSACHNLAALLCETEEAEVAKDLVELLTPYYDQVGDRQSDLHRRWLQGIIARETGEPDRAEERLLGVIAELSERSPFQAAVATLDLALLLHEEGRVGELARLSASLPPIFESQQSHRDGMAAALLFQSACRRQTLSRQLMVALREYFTRAHADPSARLSLPGRITDANDRT